MAADAELEFVARLVDEASSAADRLRRTMGDLGGPVDPITVDVLADAARAEQALAGAEAAVREVDGMTATAVADLDPSKAVAGGQEVETALSDVEREAKRVADLKVRVQAEVERKKLAAEFDALVREAERAGDEAGSRFAEGLKTGAKGAGAGLAVAGGIAGAAFLSSMDDEVSTDRMLAALGIEPVSAEAARLGGVSARLYAGAWGENLEAVNGAVAAVATSFRGIDATTDAGAASLEDLTAKTLDMAGAFELDVARAAQVAGQAVNSGLAVDGVQALDLLTAAMRDVPAAVREDLLDAVDEYGPFLESIGLRGSEAFGLLAAASEKGMYGIDKTGDAIKEFTIRSTDLSEASARGYELLGMSQEGMTASILAGGDVASQAFAQIVDGLLGIQDPVAQSEAALALFGVPLEDLSVQEIPAFLESLRPAASALEDVDGAVTKVGETLNGNTRTSFESSKRSVEQWVKGLVETNGATSMAAAGAATFGSAVLGSVSSVAAVAASMAARTAATAASTVATTAETAATNAGTASRARAVVSTVAHRAAMVAGAVATGAATAAQWALNVAMTANPIGLVVVAIAALVAGLAWFFTQTETGRRAWDTFTGHLKRGAGDMVGALVQGFRAILTVWLTVADGIVSGAATALGWIPGLGGKLKAANRAFDTMKDGILTTLDRTAQAAYGFGEGSGRNVASGLGSQARNVNEHANRVGASARAGLASGAGDAQGVGIAVGQGYVRGIDSQYTAAAIAGRRLAGAATSAMRQRVEMASPSKVTREIGVMTGLGFALGLDDEVRHVEQSAARLASAAVMGTAAAAAPRATLSYAGQSVEVLTIRHEVVSPDGSVAEYDARQIADLIAGDPRAASAIAGAVRKRETRRRTTTLGAP